MDCIVAKVKRGVIWHLGGLCHTLERLERGILSKLRPICILSQCCLSKKKKKNTCWMIQMLPAAGMESKVSSSHIYSHHFAVNFNNDRILFPYRIKGLNHKQTLSMSLMGWVAKNVHNDYNVLKIYMKMQVYIKSAFRHGKSNVVEINSKQSDIHTCTTSARMYKHKFRQCAHECTCS